jgi:hypothetical protein
MFLKLWKFNTHLNKNEKINNNETNLFKFIYIYFIYNLFYFDSFVFGI